MKKVFLLLASFVIGWGLNVSAQVPSPIDETVYKNNGFTFASESWMCSSSSNNIDMSKDAFGSSMSKGIWYELKPGAYTQAKDPNTGVQLTPNPSDILGVNVSNVFLTASRMPGVYEFLYVNGQPDFCSMQIGDQAIFRVYLVPGLEGFSRNSQLCVGTDRYEDLTLGISSDLQSFVDNMGWDIVVSTYPQNAEVSMPVNIKGGGLYQYTYKIDDSQGPFAGKYNGMPSEYKCVDSASITYTVTIVKDSISSVPELAPITYCLANLKLQNAKEFYFYPSSVLNFTAPGGKWTSSSSYIKTLDENTGKAVIDVETMPAPTTIVFEYTYQVKCADANITNTAEVKLVLGDVEINDEIVNKDTTVCRNLYAGEISLSKLLGVSLPSSGVVWMSLPSKSEIISGTTNIIGLERGQSYDYLLHVSPGINDEFCTISNYSATLTVNVEDIESYNSGVAQVCYQDKVVAGNDKINLSSFISGLPQSPSVNWYAFDYNAGKFSSTPIVDPLNYDINESNFLLGDNFFKFEYSTPCGNAEGRLVVTAGNRVPNYTNKVVTYCFEDNGADAINLFQVLGVAGLNGTWTVKSSPNGVTLNCSVFDGRQQYLDDNNAAGTSNTPFTYVFEYTPDANDGCGIVNPVTVTVNITPDIVN